MQLDIATIYFVSFLIHIIIAIFLFWLYQDNKKYFYGINYWFIAMILRAITYLLVFLENHFPTLLGIFFPHTIGVISTILIIYGMAKFINKPITYFFYIMVPLFIIYMLSITYLLFFNDDRSIRVIIVSIFLMFLTLYIVLLLISEIKYNKRYIIFAVIFITLTIYHFIRILLILFYPMISNNLNTKNIESIFTIIIILINISTCLSLTLLIINRYQVNKAVLLKEIHHRVKNNLQIILGLIEMESNKLSNKWSKNLLNNIQTKIYTLAGIHKSLYQSNDLVKISYEGFIRNFIEYISSLYKTEEKKIVYNLNISNLSLNINNAIPVSLIINEIVTNSILHGFPDYKNGQISIDFSSKKNNYLLIISDNGIGLPNQFSLDKVDSVGFNMIKQLLHQIDGQIHIKSCTGTCIQITFPYQEYSGPISAI